MQRSTIMGSSCSSQCSPGGRRRKESVGSYGTHNSDGSTCVRSSLKHSVLSTLPDDSIAKLFPRHENYVDETNGTRTPKSLADLATEEICRSLPNLNGELPPGLPPDVVENIVKALTKHGAINEMTLCALRNCEIPMLSLANCRGVTDSWLTPLSSRTFEGSPGLLPMACESDSSMESMELDTLSASPGGSFDYQNAEEHSTSSTSFISATSNPDKYGEEEQQLHNMQDITLSEMDQKMQAAPATPPTDEKPSHSNYFLPMAPTFVTTNITLLDLRGSQRLTDNGLLQLHDLSCLEVAKLDNCHSIQGRGLLALASSYRLHTLSLANCRRLTDEALLNISHLISLQALSLRGCRCLTDRSMAHLSNLIHLSKLDISQCDLLTDEGVDMLESLENLEELSVGWCRQLTDEGIKKIIYHPQRANNLKVLCLARCDISNEGIKFLPHLLQLQELDLNGCKKLTSSHLGYALDRMLKLERLDVSYCPGILSSSWQGKIDNLRSIDLSYASVRDSHIVRLRSLPKLEELYLDSCPVGDRAMIHLADNHVVPNLQRLHFSDTELSDLGMSRISKFSKLKELSLFYCGISNEGLKSLAKLTDLEHLNLDSRDISDEGLRHLRPLRKLVSLDIFSGRITDSGCAHLSNIKSLESLELCGGGVGDMGCAFLATLENLQSLNLSQNHRISNRGAAALASLTKLKALNLSNTRVNSSALCFFAGLQNLQSLALYGCNGIERGERLDSLQHGLPNLRCVRLLSSMEDEGKAMEEEEHAEDIHWARGNVAHMDTSEDDHLLAIPTI